jgi:hypothetical protein
MFSHVKMSRVCSLRWRLAVFTVGIPAIIWVSNMMKETLILGVVGAAAIYAARQIPAVGDIMDKGVTSNGKLLPVPDVMPKNGWSALFVAIPAGIAYYLSK